MKSATTSWATLPIQTTPPSPTRLRLVKVIDPITDKQEGPSFGALFLWLYWGSVVNIDMSNLFQDKKTGKLVEFINKHDKEYAMVRDAGGNIAYVNLDALVPYDKDKGTPV